MILGCFATGFSALAASTDFQAGINAAIANDESTYEWTGEDVTLENTLVIDVDIAIDFNNAIITGADEADLVNLLIEEYGIDEKTAADDVNEFISKIKGEGFVE